MNITITGHWFNRDASGEPVTRETVCDCGTQFTQYELSERQCAAWEKADVMSNVLRQVPERYVPVHCPACESKDLRRQALIDEARAISRATYNSEPR